MAALDDPGRTLLCPIVVERDDETAALRRALDGALAGTGRVVALVGDAGVGKTRLARELGDAARARDVAVLVGRAVPSASPVPYRPLTGAFLAAFRSTGPPAATDLAGFEGQLGRLVPEWGADDAGGAVESPVLLGEAVLRLARHVAAGTATVLVLEDLHWADAETLAVVEYLADALAGEPVLCVVTARPEGAVPDVLARLRRLDGATTVALSPLSDTGIDRALAACLQTEDVPADVRACIAANSEGNPFLVEELLAGLVASGALVRGDGGRWSTTGLLAPSVPFDFATSMERRLAPLDPVARHILRAGALLGRRFEWELLPGIAEVDGRAVVDALRRAVAEQVVEVDGDGFRFRHALTREAVLGELLPPERRDLAGRAWPAVERAHPGLPGAWCELVADLAEIAGAPSVAAARLLESARRAMAGGALATAERTAERARDLAASDEALVDEVERVLVDVLALAGKPDRAAAVGDPLVDRLTQRGADAVQVLVVLARAAVAAGDTTRAEHLVERARAGTDPGDGATTARIDAVAAHAALLDERLDDASRLARSAVDRAGATGQPAVECEALEVVGRVDRARGHARWAGALERAAAVAAAHGLTTWHLRARHELALWRAYIRGDDSELVVVRDAAEAAGALVTVAVMDLALAELALGRFDGPASLEHATRCVAASRQFRLPTLPVANLWLAGAHAIHGDDEAMDAAAAAALAPDPHDPRILGDLWGRVRSSRSMLRDDHEQLRRDLDTMMTYVRVAPASTSMFPNRIVWGILSARDDDDHGAAALAELREATHLRGWPLHDLALLVIEAVSLGRAGRPEEADGISADAVAQLLAHPGSRGFTTVSLLLAAEAAGRDGWGEPVVWLRRAEAFFAERGHAAVVRRCRRLLAEAGAPVPRRGRGDSVVPEHLRAVGITSRELDVLDLVVAGLSNRQVADRLFLSPKTVERHLSSLFARTGVRSRTDLASWVTRHTP